jgi:hypothetical protein
MLMKRIVYLWQGRPFLPVVIQKKENGKEFSKFEIRLRGMKGR